MMAASLGIVGCADDRGHDEPALYTMTDEWGVLAPSATIAPSSASKWRRCEPEGKRARRAARNERLVAAGGFGARK